MSPFKNMLIQLKGKIISTNHAYRHTSMGGFARQYMDKKAVALKEDYQWQIKQQILAYRTSLPLINPLELFIRAYLPTKRLTDWDNLHKLSMDACNGLVWVDDKQVWKATVERLYSKENPRIELSITESHAH